MRSDVVIVGAGIVGLASAHRLLEQKPHLRLSVIDKEKVIALHQTGNNSGVIHSGIYYKPGSLKAKNCIEGYQQLLQFCKEEEIPHKVCGKVIVATKTAESPLLENIYRRGIANGLSGLKKICRSELKEIEPHVNGIEAIWVPQAGIINYRKVAEAYKRKILAAGGKILLGEQVLKIRRQEAIMEVATQNQTITTKLIINCAGLYSDKVAEMTQKNIPIKIVPFRGEYYKLKPAKEYLVNKLIYPVPNPAFPFLGVHFTPMIGGGVEAGPNAVLAFKREGYNRKDVDIKELLEVIRYPGFRKLATKYWKEGLGELYRSYSKRAFVRALQELIPEIDGKDLVTGKAGVRATALKPDGSLPDDYLILEKKGVINICNAPSPAATSSLAIGQTIADLALRRGIL